MPFVARRKRISVGSGLSTAIQNVGAGVGEGKEIVIYIGRIMKKEIKTAFGFLPIKRIEEFERLRMRMERFEELLSMVAPSQFLINESKLIKKSLKEIDHKLLKKFGLKYELEFKE